LKAVFLEDGKASVGPAIGIGSGAWRGGKKREKRKDVPMKQEENLNSKKEEGGARNPSRLLHRGGGGETAPPGNWTHLFDAESSSRGRGDGGIGKSTEGDEKRISTEGLSLPKKGRRRCPLGNGRARGPAKRIRNHL